MGQTWPRLPLSVGGSVGRQQAGPFINTKRRQGEGRHAQGVKLHFYMSTGQTTYDTGAARGEPGSTGS